MGVKKGVKAQAQFFARLEVGSEAHWVRLFTSKCELKVVKLATALAIPAEFSDSDSSDEEEPMVPQEGQRTGSEYLSRRH